MVREHGASSLDSVEHYIDIPPSVHAHRVQVSCSPKKHVVSVERFDSPTPAHAGDDDTLIAARLEALSLRGSMSASTRKQELTPRSNPPTPARSAYPELKSAPEAVVNAQVVADVDGIDDTPIDEVEYIPVHLRWVGGRRDRASYAVPSNIRELYPPNNRDREGWKKQRYYVVIRGYETGIFYDFWGRIKPFGFIPGAMAKGFDQFKDAHEFWHDEREAGRIRVLHRCD